MTTMQYSESSLATLMIRVSGFTVAGAAMALVLFVIMSKLAESDSTYVEPKPTVVVAVNGVQDEKPTKVKETPLPQPPKKKQMPPQVKAEPIQENALKGFIAGEFNVEVPKQLANIEFGGNRNNDATPIFRVEPKYPVKAATEGIEGWVSLSFSIDELGRVIDIQVMDSNPKRYFERAARKALKKWKYQPKLVAGKPVIQNGQSVLLEFAMSQS